jgi:hypothetical protein
MFISSFRIIDLPYCQDYRNDPSLGVAEESAVPLEDSLNTSYKEVREVLKEANNLRPEDQEDDNHLEDQTAVGTVAAQAVVTNNVEGPEDLETCTWAPNHISNPAMSVSLEFQGKTLVAERQIAEAVSLHMWREIGPACPCSCLSTNLHWSLAQFLLYLRH